MLRMTNLRCRFSLPLVGWIVTVGDAESVAVSVVEVNAGAEAVSDAVADA